MIPFITGRGGDAPGIGMIHWHSTWGTMNPHTTYTPTSEVYLGSSLKPAESERGLASLQIHQNFLVTTVTGKGFKNIPAWRSIENVDVTNEKITSLNPTYVCQKCRVMFFSKSPGKHYLANVRKGQVFL